MNYSNYKSLGTAAAHAAIDWSTDSSVDEARTVVERDRHTNTASLSTETDRHSTAVSESHERQR